MTTLDVTVSVPKPGQTQYSYSLTRSDGTMAGPLQQEYTIEVNQALVKASCLRIDRALQNATSEPELLHETLLTQGRLLYKQLLQPPQGTVLELVRQLRESSEPLLVNSNEFVVPWELLHDGEDFLGLKADVGRRSKVNGWVFGGRDIGPVRRALVVGDTLGDLPKAREEAGRIGRWLSAQDIECNVLTGVEAELDRIILELSDEKRPYDLFHFSGHVSTQPDALGLIVHRRELIDAPALRTLAGRGAPPVVFINGCASADLTMSVCRSFMMMGAKTVVGTRSVVDDASALRFAEAFYGALRERVAAGAAVRAARLALTEVEDGSWASFVLHGDPSARITSEPKPAAEPPTEPEVFPFAPDARALMANVMRIAAPSGLVTSIDLLAGLVETTEIRERSLPRIGQERLADLRDALRSVSEARGSHAAGEDHGTPGKINNTHPRVSFSDTVTRVLALADDIVAVAGRGALTVDDIAAALLRVGGSACADLLELRGISMEQLLAPTGSGIGPGSGAGAGDRVPLDALDARALGIVQCARLLTAVRGESMISSYVLLKAFAVTGSEALSSVVERQGQDVERTMRRLANVNAPRAGHLSSRVAAALESIRAQGRAGEAELLLALLTDPESSARTALSRLGVDPERVVRDLMVPAPAGPAERSGREDPPESDASPPDRPEPEPESDSEPKPKPKPESEPESEPDSEPKPESEPEPKPKSESVSPPDQPAPE